MGVDGGERDSAEGAEGAEYAGKKTARMFTTEDTEGTEAELRAKLLGGGQVFELGYFADG
jgi:hypothetical protein